jgi:hypothetical protein
LSAAISARHAVARKSASPRVFQLAADKNVRAPVALNS